MRITLAAVLLLVAAPAFAEESKLACPSEPALSAPFTHWANVTPIKAASEVADAPALTIGQAYRIALLDAARVTPQRTQTKGGKDTAPAYSGVLSVTVTTARTYGLAASDGVWIDMVKAGKALKSLAHGHGPDCSGIRKIVDFALEPGDYEVRLLGNKAPALTVMIIAR